MKPVRLRARASAPGKVILFGEHFVVYNKPAILASIDKRVYIDVKVRNDSKFVIRSNMGLSGSFDKPYQKIIESKPAKSLLQPIIVAAKDAMNAVDAKIGLNIRIRSEFPYGVGLGSSAACAVATIAAVGALFRKFSRKKICDISLHAERLAHNNPSGADSAICTYGGLMLFNRNHEAKPINSKIDLYLIVANSGIQRITGKLVSTVRQQRERNAELFMGLSNMSENITLQGLKAIKGRDYSEIGSLMTLNHSLLKRLGVSQHSLDRLVEVALNNGALGAKITGAGGGGCIIALTEQNKQSAKKIMKAMKKYDVFLSKVEHDGVIIY